MLLLNILDTFSSLDNALRNRLVYAFFSFLVFTVILYFWNLSRSKFKTTGRDGDGLVYLSFVFLLNGVLGVLSVYEIYQRTEQAGQVSLDNAAEGFQTPVAYFILSSLINFCYLSALSFFSVNRNVAVDRMVSHKAWANGVKYAAFLSIIVISINQGNGMLLGAVDLVISIVAVSLLGFFIARYFILRNLKFIGLLAFGFYAIIVAMEITSLLSGGFQEKFIHVNTFILGPSLASSVIILSYAFSWINELNFYELSNIWITDNSTDTPEKAVEEQPNRPNFDKQGWKEKIAKDQVEKVIEEIIVFKKYRNESLEDILHIASRNTRNNNNQLKSIIKYEDYQLNRNQITDSLLTMLNH